METDQILQSAYQNIPNVGDLAYTDTEDSLINYNIETISSNNHTIIKCETNTATISGLMLDFYDSVDINDYDLIFFSDNFIWSLTTNNQCKTLSEFMQSINASSYITMQNKIKIGYSLEWLNISPKNITIPNLYQGSHTVYWTNPGNDYYNRITVYSSSLNVIWQSNMLFYQSSYTIDADTWADNFAGAGSVLFVVEGWQSTYPITGPYRSYQYLFIIT